MGQTALEELSLVTEIYTYLSKTRDILGNLGFCSGDSGNILN